MQRGRRLPDLSQGRSRYENRTLSNNAAGKDFQCREQGI